MKFWKKTIALHEKNSMCISKYYSYQEVFGFEVAVDDDAGMQVEEGAAEVLHHVSRVNLTKLHALRDCVKQVATLRGRKS